MAVVNQAFVKRFFESDEDPIGQQFGLDLPEIREYVPDRRAWCGTRSSQVGD